MCGCKFYEPNTAVFCAKHYDLLAAEIDAGASVCDALMALVDAEIEERA